MSRVLCQRERGADSLVAVFMGEDGEEYPFDGDRSAKTPMGRVRRRTSRKRHSMALVVCAALRQSGSLKVKQARSSSRSALRQATASG